MFLNLTTEHDTATSELRRLRLRNKNQTHRLADITALKYSTFIVNGNNHAAPGLVLQLEKSPGQTENIFFEPRLQTGSNPAAETINAQPEVVLNQWQEWDVFAGGWGKENAIGTPGFALFTLAAYVAENPQARILNTSPAVPNGGGGVRFTVGGDSPDFKNFKGYIDGFTINRPDDNGNTKQPSNKQLLVYDFDCVHKHHEQET